MAPANQVRISEDASWIARRVYATLASTYVARGMALEHALNQAADEARHAALAFDHHFPTGETIDVLPSRSATIDVGGPNERGHGFVPGIESFPKNARQQEFVERMRAATPVVPGEVAPVIVEGAP